jgi:hypothetical protein
MDPLTSPPPRRRGRWRLGILLAALLLVGGVTFHQTRSPRHDDGATKNLRSLKQIGIACKLYAMDHEGAFPPSIRALEPDYLSSVALRELAYRDAQTNRVLDWLYYPGIRGRKRAGDDHPRLTASLSARRACRGASRPFRRDASETRFQRQIAQQRGN